MFSSTKKCKTCGETISKKAKACPHCGHDYGTKKDGGTSIVTWLVLIGIVMYFVGSAGETNRTVSHARSSTPTQKHNKDAVKVKTAQDEHPAIIDTLNSVLRDQVKFDRFPSYNSIDLPSLNDRVSKMRGMGKVVFFSEETAKKYPDAHKLWVQAKKHQISIQKKHYPKMRDRLGPLLRERGWEHNLHVKTVGKRYKRIIFTSYIFANNAAIKAFREKLGVMLSDYRFTRADFKWIKDASEWTYFNLPNKKDDVL